MSVLENRPRCVSVTQRLSEVGSDTQRVKEAEMESDGAEVTDLKVFLGAAFCLSSSDPPSSILSFSQDLTGRITPHPPTPFPCDVRLFCDTLL